VWIGISFCKASCQELSSAELILRYEIVTDEKTPDENVEWRTAPLASTPKDSTRTKRIGPPRRAATEETPLDKISPPETVEPVDVMDTAETDTPERENEVEADQTETENPTNRLETLIRHALNSPENVQGDQLDGDVTATTPTTATTAITATTASTATTATSVTTATTTFGDDNLEESL